MIYVYGNSHANVFTKNPPGFCDVGKTNSFTSITKRPMSAHDFILNHWKCLISFLSTIDKDVDYVLITAGEHDCRMETHFMTRNEISWKDGIHQYIDEFIDVFRILKELGYNPIGWGGHPSFNIEFSKEWNSYMQKKCLEINIPFVTIMPYLIGENDSLVKKYYLDEIHLNFEETYPLLEWVFKSHNFI